MMTPEGLPDYARMLGAYHRAFAVELRRMIAALPIQPGQRVLDMACGDGAYTPWLAERVGPAGDVVGVDVSRAFLDLARETVVAADTEAAVAQVAAPIEALPFPDASFDLAWCAQSLYSLPDPVEALRHLRRVVCPGGVVAVLENDTLHHLLMPWPVEIELAIRAAEYRALADETGTPRKFYEARRLPALFRAAGFDRVEVRTYATDRRGPLKGDDRAWVGAYLRDLRERVGPRLAPAARANFDRIADPDSNAYMLDDADLLVTCIDRVIWGVRPLH
jgi:ubiquinone/menaquinone biosynthesis C-methylase UbiE